jgi:chemotaxis protein histidine kinase CheA
VTAPPQVNGHPRPAPALLERDAPTQHPQPALDPVAVAEAEAIRARAAAEIETARLRAEAEAEAIRIKAEAEAEKQRLANERNAMRLEKERADHLAKVAEATRRKEESERATKAAREKEAAEKQEQEAQAQAVADADDKWRTYAIRFAVVCAIVALPVQISAFWNPHAPWMASAPVMLEGGAWVVHRGAAAAVANRRPNWHYRVIVWMLACIAAAINLFHGLSHFDIATACGTAFASLAGPGVWDLHEHGRIRTRDGKLTWQQRRRQRAEEKRLAEEKAAAELRAAEIEAYREKAAREAAEQLATDRAAAYPKVWEHALKLAAALGETTVTEAVWKRAHRDIEGTDPGDSVDVIRTRNAASRRVEAALSEAPGNTPTKVTNTQRVSQMPTGRGRGSKTGPAVRGVRRPGDTKPYVKAARTQASITARTAAATAFEER